ncbi:LysR family transcriptional regulator [Oceanisphaera avium]|uniref:LysR family transcriptional regulator n=1 Tax=Oceanisphaera avium TaxID=1903694 RepID=A0A1Y0CUW5_9GAMM|nr:LysR family transcriptional regulator [Oceanisphaera avium]ART79072.1 LysR family transcriptional regulator [Oceanisphaera avium]
MYRPKSTIEQWRIFQAVVDEGGYAQAADKLNKSQSSLNHAVAKLQQSLGVALLEVQGRKAYLTDEGRVFLHRSRKITHNFKELESLADVLASGWEAVLRVVVEASLPRQPLYNALSEFASASRGCRVHLLEAQPAGCQAVIKQEAADFIITSLVTPDTHSLALRTTVYVPVCAPAHPLAQLNEVSALDLENQLELILSENKEAEKGWKRADQRWYINHLHDTLSLLRRGVGFSWLPEEAVMTLLEANILVRLPLSTQARRQRFSYLVTPHSRPVGPAANLLLSLIRKHYGACAI